MGRAGNLIPVPEANGSTNWVEVGVNIDAKVRELNRVYAPRAKLEVTSEGKPEPLEQPTIGQMRISVSTTVVLGKTTQVACLDDPVTQRRFEVDALLS
ncbi:MAG TPA: hypothetical protein VGK29_08495 [Paludibaculum sp.]